jgi:hypothetical protein
MVAAQDRNLETIRLTPAEESLLARIMGFGRSAAAEVSPSNAGSANLQRRGYLAVTGASEPIVDKWVATVLGTFALARATLQVRIRAQAELEKHFAYGHVGRLAVERSVAESSGEVVYSAIPAPTALHARLLDIFGSSSPSVVADDPCLLVRRTNFRWARSLAVSDGAAAAARALIRDGMPELTSLALASTLADTRTQVELLLSARRPNPLHMRPLYGLTLLRGPATCWEMDELLPEATHLFVQPVDAKSLSARLEAVVALAWSL